MLGEMSAAVVVEGGGRQQLAAHPARAQSTLLRRAGSLSIWPNIQLE